ncbi:MAG: hypothetical protein PHE78_07280 [Candidatus Gastranaerophilales bacterium]|nr:hypothetical protein [Candidatus Gastranaerophilales bacterium]
MIKVNYEQQTGNILGFYHEGISYPNGIPTPSIEISDEQHMSIMEKQDMWKIIDNELVDISATEEYFNMQSTLVFQEAKAKKIRENAEAYDLRLQGGILFNSNKFDCDDKSLLRLTAQLMDNQMKNLMEPIVWFNYNYNPQTLSVSDFAQLQEKVKTFITNLEAINCETNVAIQNAPSIEDLSAIEINYSSL